MSSNSNISANTVQLSAPSATLMHFAWVNFHYMDSWNCKAAPQSKVMQYYTGACNILQSLVNIHFYLAWCLFRCLVTGCQTYPSSIIKLCVVFILNVITVCVVFVWNIMKVCVVFVLNTSFCKTTCYKISHLSQDVVEKCATQRTVSGRWCLVTELVAKYVLEILLKFVSFWLLF